MTSFIGERYVAEEQVGRLSGEPTGTWCVVDYQLGGMARECLTREQAEQFAAELNDEADGEAD
jgi:hypothetical protein